MHTNHNDGDTLNPNPTPHGHGGPRSDENPGYEISDINVHGIVVFLAGLSGFVLIFFVVCFGLGKVINSALAKNDGPVTKWNQTGISSGDGENLATNPEMQQKALQQITKTFPQPVLEPDDGLQATSDLHAREDLLLEHYSTSPKESNQVRIPIDEAMKIIAKRGLPQAPQVASSTQLAEDKKPEVQAPLTTGFARTGYELEQIESREQKMSYEKASSEMKK